MTAKELPLDDSALATLSEIDAMTTTAEIPSFTESSNPKVDEIKIKLTSPTVKQEEGEEEESSSTVPDDDQSTDSLIHFTSQGRSESVEQHLHPDSKEVDEEAEAAERAIEVSVSSSISSSSVSQSVKSESVNHTVGDTTSKNNATALHSNFFPINNKVVSSATTAKPRVPVAVKNEDHHHHQDYDYDNMELPPSLPNLE